MELLLQKITYSIIFIIIIIAIIFKKHNHAFNLKEMVVTLTWPLNKNYFHLKIMYKGFKSKY